ncbi:DUF1641 domain-containing protein [Sulfobacillus thermosulfidooxidans]|uniref:DUF1641 domain-containing protein n=1 Tax=Sulfobacillus thermosulfidooxidans TaxID=28034 RepID=UPI0006B5D098|nr:DUF1641 domain-containing protein [Sulfobacillus thermosulfidooxidans]
MATIQVSNETLGEWTALLTALRDSATPAMAERIGNMLNSLGQLTQRAAEPGALDALDTVIERHDTIKTSLDQLAQWQHDGTWKALTEFTALLTAVKNSATPAMAERLGTLLANSGDLATLLTDPDAKALVTETFDHSAALTDMLAQLGQWHQDGTWKALTEFTALLTAVKNSATPAMAERLGTLLANSGDLATLLTDPDAKALVTETFDHSAALTDMLAQLGQWHQDGTWKALTEFTALLTAVKNSATPAMAERIGTLMSQFGTLATKATDSDALHAIDHLLDNQQGLLTMMDQLIVWQKNGTWNALVELTSTAKAIKDSLNPVMIERLATVAQQAGNALNQALTSGLLDLGLDLFEQLTDAFAEAQTDSRKVTLGSMLRMLKEPEIQVSLKTLFGLLRRLPTVLESTTS